MKSKNPLKSDLANLNFVSRKNRTTSLRLSLRVGAILIVAGLLASSFYLSSAASASKAAGNQKSAIASEAITTSSAVANLGGASAAAIASSMFFVPPPQAAPSIAIYAGDCSTPKTVFNLQDTDKAVCAKVTGADPTWRILWSNANNVVVQDVAVGSGTSTFTLTAASSLGDWRVILYEPFGGNVYGASFFTVIDALNPQADVSISKSTISGGASSGGQVIFAIQVSNSGPSDAAAVTVTDAVPSGTTFVSFDRIAGPIFACTSPTPGSASGSSVCSLSSLARGESAIFLGTYTVGASATVISNTATATTTTPDTNPDNDSSTATVEVSAATCQLSTPANITVDADAGQAGAVVTYATPTGTGDCGQPTTGEGGEPIPAISCSPSSGSFFPVGSTTVICLAQTGGAVSFQVTVNNPGGLSISLNGANPLILECGTAFTDPGATAVNGAGNPVEVTVTGPTIDRDTPVGSYTLTYTATEDPNSVSTTRTVVISDTQGPQITIDGANPYKIQQGSCSPFVDPGVSAADDCTGAKPVTSTTSGPGGATSVNPAVAGTYTITYTATDGTYETTATRTVIVGTFPEDEVDQPGTSNVPPTITLNGADQITIECGAAFTDPGATASVCGGPVTVTTTGSVDVHTPGIYSITYSATANGFTTEATRTVTVEPDATAPIIALNGANPMTVECHTSFTDPGAVAQDACAGNFPATASGSVDANTVGTYTITYNATDPSGHVATPVTRTVNVVDTTAPVVTAPANVTVNTGAGNTSCTVVVSNATLGTASASDSCVGAVSVTRTGVPSGNIFPAGTTTITYSATDGHGNTGTATQTVTVIDNTVPTITLNSFAPSMWPPNHKYETFQLTQFVTGASDNCDSGVGLSSVVIEKVTSDEAENSGGDGNTLNDIVIAANCKSVQLRAERDGGGNGRVYTITFRVRDVSGNTTRATRKVVVPHNNGSTAVDSGVQYTVNSSCNP